MTHKKKRIALGLAFGLTVTGALLFSAAWVSSLLYWVSKQVSPGHELLALSALVFPFYIFVVVLELCERQLDATQEVSRLKAHLETLSAEVVTLRSPVKPAEVVEK